MVTGAKQIRRVSCPKCGTNIELVLADGERMCLNGHVK